MWDDQLGSNEAYSTQSSSNFRNNTLYTQTRTKLVLRRLLPRLPKTKRSDNMGLLQDTAHEGYIGSLGDATKFSNLDANRGHWRVKIAEQDHDKTALTSHNSSFRFLRMLFVMNNSRGTFQWAMDVLSTKLKSRFAWVSKRCRNFILNARRVHQECSKSTEVSESCGCDVLFEGIRVHQYSHQLPQPGFSWRLEMSTWTTDAIRRLGHPTVLTKL